MSSSYRQVIIDTYSLTHLLPPSLTPSLTYSSTHSSYRQVIIDTYSLPHLLTHLLTYSLTYSLTQLLTYSLFVPTGDHRTFSDVFNAIEAKATQSPSAGFANVDRHPYCHLTASSNVIVDQRGGSSSVDNYDPFLPWMGHRYGHGPEPSNSPVQKQSGYTKVIVPTSRVYMIGLNAPGACLLTKEWTTCKGGVDDGPCLSEPFRPPLNVKGQWYKRNDHDFN
jgi:hypothetical protein